MLDILLSWFWVLPVMYQWLNNTLYATYYIKLILGSFGNGPVITSYTMGYQFYCADFGFNRQLNCDKNRHNVIVVLLHWFWVQMVITFWLKQKLCVRSFTEVILGSSYNKLVIKSETVCQKCFEFILSSFGDGPVITKDTMCYLFFWVHWGSIRKYSVIKEDTIC